MKEIILSTVFVVVAAIGGLMSRFVFKKKPDNFIEEFSEKVIKYKTGVDIDLSPLSTDPDGFNVIDITDTLKKKEKEERSHEWVD